MSQPFRSSGEFASFCLIFEHWKGFEEVLASAEVRCLLVHSRGLKSQVRKAYQSLLNLKTSEGGCGVVIIGYWGRCGVVKTLMQYQFECELLQTFLEANWHCAAIGIFIEHLLYARHFTPLILNPQKTLGTTPIFKGELRYRVCDLLGAMRPVQFSALNPHWLGTKACALSTVVQAFLKENLDLQIKLDAQGY